ncbi:hypothetical protein BDDG_08880, partial [Blastomyces dermatitidis ATCC 18188]
CRTPPPQHAPTRLLVTYRIVTAPRSPSKPSSTTLHNPHIPPHSTDQFASRDLASSYLESLKPADSSLANAILSPFTRIKLLRHFTPDHASQSDRLPTQ